MQSNGTIHIDDVIISEYQRETLPRTVQIIAESMADHGYNPAYPILIDEHNVLIDGGHRIEAARKVGITEVPYLRKPHNGVSNIRLGLLCNADRARGREDDVFDLATLCWKLAREGWTGEQIAAELGDNWSPFKVTCHSNVRRLLHPQAWHLARNGFAKTQDFANGDDDDIANRGFAIANWLESHFRAFLKHLPYTDGDRAVMRAQVRAIGEILTRFADPKKRVTAEWIETVARRYAWHVELEKHVRAQMAAEVPLRDRIGLLKSIRRNVFGAEPTDVNRQKLADAVSALNERALGIKLYHDDALQRLPLLEDKSIALVVADPPYNVTSHEWDRIGTDGEYLEWLRQWLGALRPKLKDDYHLFLFCSPQYQARIEMLLLEEGWPLKSRVIWSHRNLSMGRDVADKFICMWEMVFHCGTHPLNWSPEWNEERFEVQEHAAPQSNFKHDAKLHPTSKPISLIEHFVRIGSKPGDIVLDPFAGGGTTGHACNNVGQRRCILIERQDEFCEVIEARLKIQRHGRL